MAILRCLPTVRLQCADGSPLKPAGLRILGALDHLARVGVVDLLITCGTEGHGPDDPHTRGEAMDLRTRDLQPQQVFDLYNALTFLLGRDFTVLYEIPTAASARHPMLDAISYRGKSATAEHLHIQIRKGFGTWPPAAPQNNTSTV